MNEVAEWARSKGLMDHTGEECVPRQVSLLEAHMNQPSRVALLQRRDGYDPERIEVGEELPAATSRRCRTSRPARRHGPFSSLRAERSRCSRARPGR